MQIDAFAAEQDSLDRQERASSRVQRDPHEQWMVDSILPYLRLQSEFTADTIGVMLDQMGVPRDLNTRRRLCSSIVNLGRAAGYWKPNGYKLGLRGRPQVQWSTV